VVRVVGLLLLLVGCDQVLGFERDAPPPVCGPFGVPTLVPLHPELEDAHDFSVDSSGTRGLIFAKFMRPSGRLTGVHAIKLVNDMWRGDPTRDLGVISALDGAHITDDTTAVGWINRESAGGPALSEYQFSTTAVPQQWGGPTTGYIDPQRIDTSIAGNVIVLPAGTTLKLRFAVTVKQSMTADPNTLRIFQLQPTRTDWELTAQADPLKSSRDKVNPNGAVLTADHGKLVYAAKVGSRAVSRLFASERIRDEFAPGPELMIEGVEGDADLTEPWINADCTAVYFLRDGKTWMATAVDVTGSAP